MSIWFPNPVSSLLYISKSLCNKFIDISAGFCLKLCLCHSQDITDIPPLVTVFKNNTTLGTLWCSVTL